MGRVQPAAPSLRAKDKRHARDDDSARHCAPETTRVGFGQKGAPRLAGWLAGWHSRLTRTRPPRLERQRQVRTSWIDAKLRLGDALKGVVTANSQEGDKLASGSVTPGINGRGNVSRRQYAERVARNKNELTQARAPHTRKYKLATPEW